MAKRLTAVAKERGYVSRSAFLRSLIEKELARDGDGQQHKERAK